MAQVAIIAKLTAVEGKSDELQAAISELVAAVEETEPGALVYTAAHDAANPSVFWFYELYASVEAAANHAAGSALAAAAERMRGLLAGPPEVHGNLTPVAATGLPG